MHTCINYCGSYDLRKIAAHTGSKCVGSHWDRTYFGRQNIMKLTSKISN